MGITRPQKKQSFSKWHLFWENKDRAEMARLLAENDDIFSAVEKGRNYATIHLVSPRKYDAMMRKFRSEELEDEISLVPIEEAPLRPASASADSAPNSGGAASASTTVEVSADSARNSPNRAPGFLMLKMEGYLSATEGNCTTANRVAPTVELGRGSFGIVYEVKDAPDVVVKVFEDAAKESSLAAWVRQELAAATAIPFHENILRPFDVALDARNCQIIYPHCGMDLSKFLKHARPEGKKLWEVEEELIMRGALHAVDHLHEHRILHTDIKPSNILVEGRGLNCAPEWQKTDGTAWKNFSPESTSRLVQLSSFLHVRLADLGSVVPADAHHRMQGEHYLHPDGIHLSTIWYRAPELSFGDCSFSTPIDVWSLGCSFHELLFPGEVLLPATSVDDLVTRSIGLFGAPSQSGRLISEIRTISKWERIRKFIDKLSAARKEPRKWMPRVDATRSVDPAVSAMMQSLLRMEPVDRLSARQIIQGDFLHTKKFEVVVEEAPCHRGPLSMQKTDVSRALLSWVNAEDYWESVLPPRVGSTNPKKRKATKCLNQAEEQFKRETPGYTSKLPPGCESCNTWDMSSPFPAQRLAAVVRALLARQNGWLKALSVEIREVLAKFPEERLMENGKLFFDTCLSDTALVYGIEQDMLASEREDPSHWDGGTSLLHAGVTLWGQRRLEYMTGDGEWHSLIQQPGSFYIANMCAAWHRVQHLPSDAAEPLFRPVDAMNVDGNASPGLHITVMLRTDVFRADFSRRGRQKARPEDVYDAVNFVVARKLAREPWAMPTLGECMAMMQ